MNRPLYRSYNKELKTVSCFSIKKEVGFGFHTSAFARWIFLVVAVVTMLLWSVTNGIAQLQPYRIGTISIDRQPVFDTSKHAEQNFISSFGNSIHWLTKERVIRDELLYSEGDFLNPHLIRETERNLRSLGFVGDVSTTIDTVGPRLVDITVHTRDKWTLGVSPSYQQGGGTQHFAFVVKDDNFLGNAQGLSLGYDYQSDFRNPHGMEAVFSERHTFGTHWASRLSYQNSDESRVVGGRLEHPYYSDEIPWAAGLAAGYSTIRRPYYENGILSQEHLNDEQNQFAYYSQSFGDETKFRPAVSFVRNRSTGPMLRTFDNVSLFNLSFNVMHRQYEERVFLNSHGRIEDVPLGFTTNILFGKNLARITDSDPNYFFQTSWQHSVSLDPNYYTSYGINFSSYLGNRSGGYREQTIDWYLLQHYKLHYNQLLVGQVAGTDGTDWSPGRQIYVGTETGLRGYNNFTITGQSRLLYNVEYRYFSSAEVWIFRPGAALFLDGGTAWSENDHLHDQRFHTAAGLGLRIENTKQQGAGTIRIDLAYNFDEHRFAGLIISSSVLFSAFRDLDFLSPTSVGDF